MATKKYILEITEEQSRLIIEALDFHTRLSCGQMWKINESLWGLDVSEKLLCSLQSEMFPALEGLNHSFGIYSSCLPERIRETYDIFKVMMYEFNKDKGIMNVYADKVTSASKKTLPKFVLKNNGG